MNYLRSLNRLVVAVALLLISCPIALFAVTNTSTTITGTFVDPSGAPLDGYVRLTFPFAGAVTTDNRIISPLTVTYTISGGSIVPGSSAIINNANISPANTYYAVSIYDYTSTLVSSYYVQIPDVASFDLGTAIQTAYTTGNVSFGGFASLTTNNIFTGTNTFNNNITIQPSAGVANSVSWSIFWQGRDAGNVVRTGRLVVDDTGEMVWLPDAASTHQWFQTIAFVVPGASGGGYSCTDGALPLFGDPDSDCFSAGTRGAGNDVDSQHFEAHARDAGGVTRHGDLYTDHVGSLTLATDTNGTTRILPKTFASYPACAAGFEGAYVAITDSTTAVWGATITGAGANHVLGYCDGTNWTVAAK